MYAWSAVDTDRLRSDRRHALRDLMQRHKLSHLLLTGFDHIRYATDYRTHIAAEAFDWCAAVIDLDGEAEIFTPWVDATRREPEPSLPWIRAIHPAPSWAPAVAHPVIWSEQLTRALRSATRVGVEHIASCVLDRISASLPDVDFVGIGQDLYDARIRKTSDEIRLLEDASVVNSLAAESAMRTAREGVTDHDLLADAMCSLQKSGAEFVSHSLCNHRRGSDWFAAGSVLRDGDPYFFDIGVYGRHGYASDIARTGFVGGDTRSEVKAVYRKLLTALDIAEEATRPGVRVADIDAAVNDYLRREGVPTTPYAVGHGVGLRACELPTIHRTDLVDRGARIVENSVIALEPETGVEIDGELIVLKVEDNYAVEAHGVRRLSTASYAFDL
ncbi:M24 family metallopeptidase [Nocardia aobensis]|uniref:M24 family metallopeptidase n=1 Tax=Nocardia aobensis TaxID=257277 RepID=A0ABW6P4X1_9NOCA